MINHLKYCLKEILIVKDILEIENSNFYKRSLARFVAIRTDDFIKLAFTINKATLNKQTIKNDLNTFQDYYKAHFKTQRDKFGAHFQELDFASRLEFWSQIDYEKSDFFSSIPIDIYKQFSTLTDYDTPEIIFSGISEELKEKIQQLNNELDIEKYPNFSSDILSLTRYNSGGLIPCSKLQVKAGVLKSLEIIIDYLLELYKISKDNKDVLDVIKKFLITDLISYCDNFITRTDIIPGAKQEEDGLDKIIEGTEFLKAKGVIDDFLKKFKFEEKLNNLRAVRNKSCGHIDVNNSIISLQTDLDSLNFNEIESFYLQIKKTYKKICNEEMVFQAFSLEPKDRAYGVQKLVGIPVKPFEKDSIPETEFFPTNVNDKQNYQIYFSLLDSKEQHEEARHFFWDCFSRSNLIEKKNFTCNNSFLKSTETIDYREAHKFFHEILLSDESTSQDKIKVLQLFLECKSGYPDTLLYILLETYSVNKEVAPLNLQYIYSFGELCSKINDNIIDILKSNIIKSDFYRYYNSLLSIYKIDIKSRQNLTIDVKTEASELSDLIRNEISKSNDFLKIAFSLGFSSELYFSNGYSIYRKPLKSLYLNYFDGVFKKSIKNYLNPLIKNEEDRRKLNTIIKFFNLNRYSTLLGLLGAFLKKKKHNKEAERYRALLYEGIVKYAYNDNNELHNFGVTCFEMKNIDLAVKVSEHIVDSNPSDLTFYYFLLSIYLQEKKYKDRFIKVKSKVLADFKLDEKTTEKFEILNYEE